MEIRKKRPTISNAGAGNERYIRVEKCGCLPPTDREDLVRQQLRAGHNYQNDLVSIERARRDAIRAIHASSPEVQECAELLGAATRSTRRERLIALARARKKCERHITVEPLPQGVSGAPELAANRIRRLDEEIRRGARALTTAYWGTYLSIEASARQTRAMSLYERDGLTPAVPRFRVGPRLGRDMFGDKDSRGRGIWYLWRGQVGVQLQGGLKVEDLLGCKDNRARLEILRRVDFGKDKRKTRFEGMLWLRVASDDAGGPIWAKWPIRVHRPLPAGASVKWIRVKSDKEAFQEVWQAHFTLEIPGKTPREMALAHAGTSASYQDVIAIETEWIALADGGVRVANWQDSSAARGEFVLPPRLVAAIRKSDGIRAVRDILLNELRPKLAQAFAASARLLPAWLAKDVATLLLWKSQRRFWGLYYRMARMGEPSPAGAFALLEAWFQRERHLYSYEEGVRGDSLRTRRHFYLNWAAQLGQTYRQVILVDRDLSYEARFGEESAVRFTASPSELEGCIRQTFGKDLVVSPFKPQAEDDERSWTERACEQWRGGHLAVPARNEESANDSAMLAGGAWARRKAAAKERAAKSCTSREA